MLSGEILQQKQLSKKEILLASKFETNLSQTWLKKEVYNQST